MDTASVASVAVNSLVDHSCETTSYFVKGICLCAVHLLLRHLGNVIGVCKDKMKPQEAECGSSGCDVTVWAGGTDAPALGILLQVKGRDTFFWYVQHVVP